MDLSQLHYLPTVACAAGSDVITEDQAITGLYFLEKGEVEVRKGGVLIAEIYEEGAVFGDMAFLLNTTPTATVRAVTPCVFRHALDPAELFRQQPEVTLHLAGILARRLDSLNRYLVNIKEQFQDRQDHLGMIDEVLDALLHKHPRDIPRRATGD